MNKDALKLIHSVERLPFEDQDKFFRIVELLSHVPLSVQDRTQRLLRELLAYQWTSKDDCLDGIDMIIEYLEDSVAEREHRKEPVPGFAVASRLHHS